MPGNDGSNNKTEIIKQIITALGGIIAALITAYLAYKGVVYAANHQASQKATEESLALTQTAKAKPTSIIPTDTDTPVLPPIDTDTPTPSPTSIFRGACFDTNIWTPYTSNRNVESEMVCWDLSNRGFFATSNGFSITPYAFINNGQAYGIYANIPKDVEIKFKIRINKLETDWDYSAYIRYGFMETKGPEKSYLIWHFYKPQNSRTATNLDVGNGGEHHSLGIQVELKTTHEVVLSVKNSMLTITFNGEKIVEDRRLSFEDRVFYISYHIPFNSQLVAYINDFEIQKK